MDDTGKVGDGGTVEVCDGISARMPDRRERRRNKVNDGNTAAKPRDVVVFDVDGGRGSAEILSALVQPKSPFGSTIRVRM